MKWIIIALCFNIVIISAQVDQSCVFSSTSSITIGLKNYICAKIVFGNNTFVYGFQVTVDKLSVLSLNNLSVLLTNISGSTSWNSTNQTISLILQFQNSNQTLQLLLSSSQDVVYRNLISIVIKSTNGIFNAIINDSQDCSTCTVGSNVCYKDYCFNNGYFLEQSNFLIYVSWVGTDLNQHHMMSYTQRLKKLSKFSLGNIFTKAFSIY